MKTKMDKLENCFKFAIKGGFKYVGVKIQMEGFKKCEIIINPIENASDKLKYYKKSYNDDLTLKAFEGIKIVEYNIYVQKYYTAGRWNDGLQYFW